MSSSPHSYREYEPHPALVPFVDRFWMNSGSPEPTSSTSRILPDGCMDIIVDLSDGARATVVGAMTSAILVDASVEQQLVGVRFRPGGATPFLRLDAGGLTDRVIDARDVGPHWLTRVQQLAGSSLAAAVRAFEDLLLAQLSAAPPPDRRVAYAVSTLFSAEPPPVADVAHDLGWSRQHLARALKQHVGVSPVQLARVARLQRAVDVLQRRAHHNLAEAALGLGYFDQAHMARDFRELAKLTPSEAAASAGSIFPIRSLLRD